MTYVEICIFKKFDSIMFLDKKKDEACGM